MKGSPTPHLKASHEDRDSLKWLNFQYEKDSDDAHRPFWSKAIIIHWMSSQVLNCTTSNLCVHFISLNLLTSTHKYYAIYKTQVGLLKTVSWFCNIGKLALH